MNTKGTFHRFLGVPALFLVAVAAMSSNPARAANTPAAGSVVTLQNANSHLCVDTGGSTGFAYLIQSVCSTSKTQQFTLNASPASGSYYLVSLASSLCWDIVGGSFTAGALIQQYTCTAVSPEYFQLKAVNGGYEILSANLTNGCVDVVRSSRSSGAHLEQNRCTGAANQIFSIGGSGSSGPAQLAASPASVGFGNVVTGTKTSQTVQSTNSGTASLTISRATASGAGFSVIGLTTPAILAAGTSTTFSVVFTPSSAGSVTGSVSLVSNASNSPATIALSGTGVSANPSVAISSPANSATVSGTITVSGTASDSVALSSVAVQVDSGAFSVASGTSNWSFNLNTTSLSNAPHTVTARATDSSGTTASTSISVTVSNGSSAGNTLNVLNYGATGNGSTDDTAAINSAIAALQPGDGTFLPLRHLQNILRALSHYH